MKKSLILIAFALFIAVIPLKAANAGFDPGRIIDPLCLFACNDKPKKVVNNITNNNTNSHNSTVINNSGTPVVVATTPTYPNYYDNYVPQLGASCYSTPTTANVGSTITWGASAYGGNGNYYISWSGSEGLSGYGTSILKSYSNAGSKYASITVTSGNQTITRNCSNVTIYDNYYYDNNYNYNYNYNYNNYYSPLSISCYANTTSVPIDSNVYWTANVSGGNGYYSYSWSGSDWISGSGRTTNVSYRTPGTKTASVTVYSGNQTVTQTCYNSVYVGNTNYNYNYNNQYYGNNNNIQVACYPDRLSARIGAPVTWSAEATGATGNFTYSWSGSESLTGNMQSIVKIYDSRGTKNATVTVTSSNGQTASQICGNSVTITNASSNGGSNTNTTIRQNTTNNQTENGLSAASLFSLKNVPWGWVAVLVILILFATVLYLLFNRNKI